MEKLDPSIPELAEIFALQIPEHEFSTAELQGYLLTCKKQPSQATAGISAWVNSEKGEKRARTEREELRKQKVKEGRERREEKQIKGAVERLNGVYGGYGIGGRGFVGGGGGSCERQATEVNGASGVNGRARLVSMKVLTNGNRHGMESVTTPEPTSPV